VACEKNAMSEPRKIQVLLCHAKEDKPIVRETHQRLSAEGWIDPWLDEDKLLPGQSWDMETVKAVETADVVGQICSLTVCRSLTGWNSKHRGAILGAC
jgi:hypothetical protein